MHFLCWNIIGVCFDGETFQLKELYRKTQPCIDGLVETKPIDFSKTLLSKWWKEKAMSFMAYKEIPVKAKSGGMVFGWDNRYFTHKNTEKDTDDNRWMMIQG